MAIGAVRIRAMRPEDARPILDLARTLDAWFNAQGLIEMERDLAVHCGYVAEEEDRVDGFATWAPIDDQIANLSWMGVARHRHGTGIGRSLLRHVVEDLRRRGYRTLVVSTVADSVDYEPYAATRRFYRAMGFADYRVDPLFFGEEGNKYDRLLLRLDVSRVT